MQLKRIISKKNHDGVNAMMIIRQSTNKMMLRDRISTSEEKESTRAGKKVSTREEVIGRLILWGLMCTLIRVAQSDDINVILRGLMHILPMLFIPRCY